MIDLNTLKNYIDFAEDLTAEQEYYKVSEEISEYKEAWLENDAEEMIAEGLDVITAVYNHLVKLGLSENHMEKHIQKLELYRETGKYGERR